MCIRWISLKETSNPRNTRRDEILSCLFLNWFRTYFYTLLRNTAGFNYSVKVLKVDTARFPQLYPIVSYQGILHEFQSYSGQEGNIHLKIEHWTFIQKCASTSAPFLSWVRFAVQFMNLIGTRMKLSLRRWLHFDTFLVHSYMRTSCNQKSVKLYYAWGIPIASLL